MDKIGKKILIAIPLLAAFFGWEYYSKGQKSEETKAEMIEMCGDDNQCVVAVKKYAEACFDENYQISRRSSGVKMDEFVACVNGKAGSELFVSVPKE